MTIRNCTSLSLDDLVPAYWNGNFSIFSRTWFKCDFYLRFSMSKPIKSPWPSSKYFRIACKCSSSLCGPITISNTFFDVFKYTLLIMICSLVSGTSANILSTEMKKKHAVSRCHFATLFTKIRTILFQIFLQLFFAFDQSFLVADVFQKIYTFSRDEYFMC